MCSFATHAPRARTRRGRGGAGSGRRVPPPARQLRRWARRACAASASASPRSTSATPAAWSKRTSVSATTNRLSGRSGPSAGSGHGRLELGGVVVAEVADDRRGLLLGLVERDDARAAADEGVAAEPALLDRLEQERRLAGGAQPEVRPERGDQVGGDDGGVVHATRKTLRLEGLVSGSGGAFGQARLPPRSWRRNQAQVRDVSCIAMQPTGSGAPRHPSRSGDRLAAWPAP